MAAPPAPGQDTSLDDRISLDRAGLRTFFESRGRGRPEAVDAVDR